MAARPTMVRSTPRTRCLLLAMLAVCATAAATSPAAVAGTHFRGQWQCNDAGATAQPLAGAALRLWGPFGPQAAGFTDAHGNFDIESPNIPFPFPFVVQVVLRDGDGVHLTDAGLPFDYAAASPAAFNDRPNRDLGGLRLSAMSGRAPCAIWRGVHNAGADYRTTIGERSPVADLLVHANAITAGVPFSAPGNIYWWPGFTATNRATSHEWAHTMRYAFDGALHYALDVVAFSYAQFHGFCNRTNAGFAFNEGWAEYWARDVTAPPGCAGLAATDMAVEGNVAAALTSLEARCGGRRVMVDILRRHPAGIHSLADFTRGLTCAGAATMPPPSTPAEQVGITLERWRLAIQARLSALRHAIAPLERQLHSAVSASGHASPCAATPCASSLATHTRPMFLRGEIAIARATRASLAASSSTKALKRLRGLGVLATQREDRARSGRLRRVVLRIAAGTMRDVLRVSLKTLKGHGGQLADRYLAGVRARIKEIGTGNVRNLPPELIAALDPGAVPKHGAVATFPEPQPSPPPPPPPVPTPPAPTSLTLACPGKATAGSALTVSGVLAPAHPGAVVTLTYGGTTAHEVVTDAAGAYSDTFTTKTKGTLTVQAHWGGDGDYLASDATPCAITVG